MKGGCKSRGKPGSFSKGNGARPHLLPDAKAMLAKAMPAQMPSSGFIPSRNQAPAPMYTPSFAPAGAQEWDTSYGGEPDEVEAMLAAGTLEGAEDMMTGTVKTWKEEKGFGFIAADGGTDDIFVHRSVLADGESLMVGTPVLFEVTYDTERKGFKATKVLGAVAREITAEEADRIVTSDDPERELGNGSYPFNAFGDAGQRPGKLSMKGGKDGEKGRQGGDKGGKGKGGDKGGKGKGGDKGGKGKGGDKGGKGKGDKGGKSKGKGYTPYSGDPFYRPSWTEDPWAALYDSIPSAAHLKAHLDGSDSDLVAAPKDEKPKDSGKRKTVDAPEPAAEPAEKKQATALDTPVFGKLKTEVDTPKATGTSIYDFFDDDVPNV